MPDEKDVPYRSTVAGRSHACGHDVHTAIVLGAGLLLAGAATRGSLPGRVRLIFQPAEELTPGGAVDVVGDRSPGRRAADLLRALRPAL